MSGLYLDQLPSILAEDDRFARLVRVFEDIGTPLYDAPAAFPTLFDPRLAPSDVARWLGGWLGLPVDESLPAERRRRFTTAAAEHFATRGSRPALEALLSAVTGGEATVTEPGSVHREGVRDGDRGLGVADIVLATRGGVPRDRLEVLIRAELPAWLPYTIVVTDEPVGDAVIEEEGVA
jgi:phage tail-like protein